MGADHVYSKHVLRRTDASADSQQWNRLSPSRREAELPVRLQHDVSDRLYAWLLAVTGQATPRRVLVFKRVRFSEVNVSLEGVMKDMDIRMEVNQEVTLEAVALDRHGNPARVDNPVWASSDESVATVEV